MCLSLSVPKIQIPKTGVYYSKDSRSRQTTIGHPNRFKQAGFSPGKIGYSGFYAIKPEIGEIVIKNTPFRPVARSRSKREYAQIES
jgi:hypothetical protein